MSGETCNTWQASQVLTVTNAIGRIREELSLFHYHGPKGTVHEVDLGGSFTPMDESVVHAWNSTDDPAGLLAKPCTMLKGDWIHLDTYHLTLFLDSLRDYTNLNSIGCQMEATGEFKIVIRATSSNESKVLRETTVSGGRRLKEVSELARSGNFNGVIDEWERHENLSLISGPWLSSKGLKPGLRITASIECLSDVGVVAKFRWRGRIGALHANLGQRVYLLRTFGNSDLVAETLNKLAVRIKDDPTTKELAKRSVFIVYDATGKDQSPLFSRAASDLRIIYTKGGNYGGGGNASFMAEAVRQAAEGLGTVDEVIIIDDDAGVDPEVFIRHDSFVTLRQPKVFTSSIVFARANPLCVQEWGGYWGRFFSELSERPTRTQQSKDQLKFYPYLVRHGQNIKEPAHLNNLAQSISVDFSTFIFISLPIQALEEIGGILPVFLRNDDVDLSLRLREKGYRLAINSNLFAYHDSGHTLSGEFFAVFHALIVNSAYSGLNLENIQRFFCKRLASALATRNLILLRTYSEVLNAFIMGPAFMDPKTIYPRYKERMKMISSWQSATLRQIPNEVVDELRSRDEIDVRILLDPLAPTPTSTRGEVIFADPVKNGYFSVDVDEATRDIPLTAKSILESLAKISNSLPALSKEWEQWVSSFKAAQFWSDEAEGFRIVDESIKARQELQALGDSSNTDFEQASQLDIQINIVKTHREWIIQRLVGSNSAEASQPQRDFTLAPHERSSTSKLLTAQVNVPSVSELIRKDSGSTTKGGKEMGDKHRKSGFLGVFRSIRNQNVEATPPHPSPNDGKNHADLSLLPYGFDDERYLRLNPDVLESSMDAKTHYLRYGRFEQRQY